MRTPRISVITSCYNAASYIRQTLESVLSQNARNLEYIVVDAGSTDGTMAIIDDYRDRLAVVISEPDDGHYHGVQKGFARATGDIFAFLNADDLYMPWTISVVTEIFGQLQDVSWITGLPSYLNQRSQCTRISSVAAAYPRAYIRNGWFRTPLGNELQQESMFWRRGLWEAVGGFNFSFKLAADFELWMRFAQHSGLASVSIPLAAFRRRPGEQRSSTLKPEYEAEVQRACYGSKQAPLLWRAVSRRGMVAKCLYRMAVWKDADIISYSEELERWVKTRCMRPISRVALSTLMLEYHVRRLPPAPSTKPSTPPTATISGR